MHLKTSYGTVSQHSYDTDLVFRINVNLENIFLFLSFVGKYEAPHITFPML